MSFYIESASVFLKRWKDLWIHHSVFFLCEFKYFFLLFPKKKNRVDLWRTQFSVKQYHIFCLFLSAQNMSPFCKSRIKYCFLCVQIMSPLCKALYHILLIMCTVLVALM